jgi:hypothetical protein
MNQITLSVVEVFISLVVESTILAGVFSYLATRAHEKQETNLRDEMQNIENQNKLIFEQLQSEINSMRADVISQIKESAQQAQQQQRIYYKHDPQQKGANN